MKFKLAGLLYCLAFCFISASLIRCSSNRVPNNLRLSLNNDRQAKLGDLPYTITIPKGLIIYEALKTGDKLTYQIKPTNESFRYFGNIKVHDGPPMQNRPAGNEARSDSTVVELLGKPTLWIIHYTQSGYTANAKNVFSFALFAKERADLDRMLSIIATLKKI